VHPAAAVKRQQERDVAVLLPTIKHLTERQHQLFFLFHTLFARHRPEGFSRLVDEDVAQAAVSVAATLETAARGVIYEHTPSSPPAQRLVREMTTMLAEMRAQGATVYDGEVAMALRAIERGAREAHKIDADGAAAYLTLVSRLLQVGTQKPADEPAAAKSSLILP